MERTAIVVDDQESFCRWASVLLEEAGLEVVGCANDGIAALEAARRLRPGVVLLDVQLPGLDGLEVARVLAVQPDPPAVILTSARDAIDYGRRLREAPSVGFIGKADLSREAISALIDEKR